MNTKGISSLIMQNRLLSRARSRAKTHGGNAASVLNSNSDSGKKALLNAIKKEADSQRYLGKNEGAAKSKEHYTAMKAAAESIQKNAKKLLSMPSKKWEEMTEEEVAKYKEDVASEMSSFIGNYNTLVNNLSEEADSKVNEIYLKQLKGYFTNVKADLEALGITQDGKGKLSLDEEKLKAADADKIKKLLGTEGTFVDDVGKRAENVAANADTNLAVLNKSLYAGNYSYNQKGNDIFDILASGGKYNAKG